VDLVSRPVVFRTPALSQYPNMHAREEGWDGWRTQLLKGRFGTR